MIGCALTRSYLFYTNDNWETNTIVNLPDSIHSDVPLYFIDSNNVVFNRYDGYNADFIRYNISHNNWSIWGRGQEKDGEYINIDDLTFVNDSLGFGCGFQRTDKGDLSKDVIWKTTDKGRTWTVLMNQQNHVSFGLNYIEARDELHIITVGSYGKVLETADGGESWFQYQYQENASAWSNGVTWAGNIPLVAVQSKGIFRTEIHTDVEELSSDHKFRVYQSGKNLEIAINDNSHSTYSFQLYNSSGQQLLTRSVKSSFGFVFVPVPLIDLTNGVYYYTISYNNSVEFSGKLVVVE